MKWFWNLLGKERKSQYIAGWECADHMLNSGHKLERLYGASLDLSADTPFDKGYRDRITQRSNRYE